MTTKRDPKIHLFYRDEQVIRRANGYSMSPLKPRLLLQHLVKNKLNNQFILHKGWKPFNREDFLEAHTDRYVNCFFEGINPAASSNGLTWNKEFAETVRYTNSSLYHAIKYAVEHPERITFSPTSGFHHAQPDHGSGFCTFSGQVIVSMKIYKAKKLVGAYVDLDGHFGNSIEDSRDYIPDLDKAIPRDCNINPEGAHADYLFDLDEKLRVLENKLLRGKVHYVVFAHGADSHEYDNLGHQCSTKEWLLASRMVYSMIRRVSEKLGHCVPLTLSLFGGYRHDDYASVLNLHTGDLVTCLNIMCNKQIDFEVKVKIPAKVRNLMEDLDD